MGLLKLKNHKKNKPKKKTMFLYPLPLWTTIVQYAGMLSDEHQWVTTAIINRTQNHNYVAITTLFIKQNGLFINRELTFFKFSMLVTKNKIRNNVIFQKNIFEERETHNIRD